MTQTMLKLAPALELPPEAALQRYGILAMSGAGKSNTSVVMAEEFYAAGVPWVAVDPKGDWWGVRASASGKGPGLEVPVFGGLHGDLPLEEEAGAMMAELIAETRLTCILDVSEFSSHEAMLEFLTVFAETLYRKNREPLHIFAEEADEFIPQKATKKSTPCVNAWSRLVKRGRFRGLFVTLISQRSAALNNEALSQVDTLMPMRTAAPADKKAIEAWVTAHDFGRDLIDSLPSLKDGELWLWSPHKLGLSERVRFRRRRTFDSGATPGLEGRLEPTKLADIDLDVVKERMAGAIERAEEEDPTVLQGRVAELEDELDTMREREKLLEERPTEPVEVEKIVEVFPSYLRGQLKLMLERILTDAKEVAVSLEEGLKEVEEAAEEMPQGGDMPRDNPGPENRGNGSRQPSTPDIPRDNPGTPQAAPEANGAGAQDLGRAERKILGVLAQFSEGRTKVQVAILSGYSAKSGGFNNALGKLRTKGLISEARIDPIVATQEGVAAAGDVDPIPTGGALLTYWQAKVGKAEREILRVLFEHGPLGKEDIGELTGYSTGSGGFNNALGKLRTLELISPARVEPIAISEIFRA